MFLTFVVSLLTLNLKQKMSDFTAGFITGCVLASVIAVFHILSWPDSRDAYTKGITDCRSGKVSYTVTVGPEGVDTTYTYKP